jgi:hypothetical protein
MEETSRWPSSCRAMSREVRFIGALSRAIRAMSYREPLPVARDPLRLGVRRKTPPPVQNPEAIERIARDRAFIERNRPR